MSQTIAAKQFEEFLPSYRLYASAGLDLGDVIAHYKKFAAGKRMVLFAWSIESSAEMAAKFNAEGIPAVHIDGKTVSNERDVAMDQFKAGKILVLCNVNLFAKDVDLPAVEAVALLRPTQSLALYLQQVGHALRPAPGKKHAVIFDYAGNCKRFGLPDNEHAALAKVKP